MEVRPIVHITEKRFPLDALHYNEGYFINMLLRNQKGPQSVIAPVESKDASVLRRVYPGVEFYRWEEFLHHGIQHDALYVVHSLRAGLVDGFIERTKHNTLVYVDHGEVLWDYDFTVRKRVEGCYDRLFNRVDSFVTFDTVLSPHSRAETVIPMGVCNVTPTPSANLTVGLGLYYSDGADEGLQLLITLLRDTNLRALVDVSPSLRTLYRDKLRDANIMVGNLISMNAEQSCPLDLVSALSNSYTHPLVAKADALVYTNSSRAVHYSVLQAVQSGVPVITDQNLGWMNKFVFGVGMNEYEDAIHQKPSLRLRGHSVHEMITVWDSLQL